VKLSPNHYVDWINWANGKYKTLYGEERDAFLGSVFHLFNLLLVDLRPGPLNFRTGLKLAAGRWDPLEAARNRMEAMRKTYGD
jgi:hypothetical protein